MTQAQWHTDGDARIGGDAMIGGALAHQGAEVGFFNVTPAPRPAALTPQLTTITHTAPGAADYALQDLVDGAPFGFVTKDEGNTLLAVVANLQARVGELEARLQSLGLLE